MTRRDSIWKSLDWVTIVVYLLLIVFGWFSVCGASYDYGDRDFLDFSTRAGKQFVWIICSFGLGFVLLMLDDSLYDMFSYLIYIGLMLLLIVTIFIAPDTKRVAVVAHPGAGQFAAGGVCQVCHGAGACQVYECLLVYDEELEKLPYVGFPDSLPHVADYPTAGDGFGIGVLCIFPDALSGGNAGRGTVLGYMCSGLLCGGHPF